MAEGQQMPRMPVPMINGPEATASQNDHSPEFGSSSAHSGVPLDLHYSAGDRSAWDRITDPREFNRMAPVTLMFLGGGLIGPIDRLMASLAASSPGVVAKLLARFGWAKPASLRNADLANSGDASRVKATADAEPLPTTNSPAVRTEAAQNALVAERELLLKQQYLLYQEKQLSQDRFLEAVRHTNEIHRTTIGTRTQVLPNGEKVTIVTEYRENYILVDVRGADRSVAIRFDLSGYAGRQSERESFLVNLYQKVLELNDLLPVTSSKNLPSADSHLSRAAGGRGWIPLETDRVLEGAERRLHDLVTAMKRGHVSSDRVKSAIEKLNHGERSSWAVLRDPATGSIAEDVSFFWEYLPDGNISMVIEGLREPVSYKFGPEYLGRLGARIQWLIQSYVKQRSALPVRDLRP